MKKITFLQYVLIAIIFSCSNLIYGQTTYPFQDKSLPVEQRMNDLLNRMTLDEKIDVLSGYNGFYIHPCVRLGVPAFKMADGPLGIASWGWNGRATAFPAALSLAASWNKDLASRIGSMYAQEWRARGIHIMLAPGVNNYRASKDARNFEYLGEDPYLASAMVVPFIKGVQAGGVLATIKHFAANDQEFDRYSVSTEVSERALQEIYLPPFKAAVQKAGVKALMTGYNLVNGTYCSENKHLLKDILEKDWGFKGMVMSDWGATHSTLESALNGLDMEMGSNDWFIRDKLMPLIKEGKISEDLINEKVRRIYGACMEMGFFDRPQHDTSIPTYNPKANEAALQEATEGIILLKNQHRILPLANPKVIAVIGPNANPTVVTDNAYNVMGIVYGGGGSSKVNPWYVTNDLQGIKQEFPKSTILYTEGISNEFVKHLFERSAFTTNDGHYGLTGKYFAITPNVNKQVINLNLVMTRTDSRINFEWGGKPFNEQKLGDEYKVEWEGYMTPQKTDSIYFFVHSQGAYRLWIDNQLIFDASTSQSFDNRQIAIAAQQGQKKAVKLEYYNRRSEPAEIRLGYAYQSDIDFSEAERLAAKANVVIFCGGLDGSLELEGRDRPFELPFGQDILINRLAKINPKTIVVLHAGGGVDMTKWINNVSAVFHALYPGQEGGTAIARLLSGEENPSAKLPFTIEKSWKDSPACGNYDETRASKKVYYREGVFTGYRGYEKKNIEPLFPFGYGLSYSTFEYSNLKAKVVDKKEGKVKVSLTVKNTSDYPGSEVIELYVHQLAPKEERPYKELKNFEKEWFMPKESKKIEMELSMDDFQYYNEAQKAWVFEKGKFDILVGASSRDIRLQDEIKF
jgi:beta-glucosidase